MACSAMLLSLVLLLASSSAWVISSVPPSNNSKFTHIHLYMHETTAGLNATVMMAVSTGLGGGNTTFGMVELLDNELRDGPDPSNSSLVGRFQGIVAFLGLVSPPGKQSAISFVFTAGEHTGSTLSIMGPILFFDGALERAVVGGTGAFRMSRGYCIVRTVSNPTPVSTVYEVNLFLKMDS